jgi:hypothetical protein
MINDQRRPDVNEENGETDACEVAFLLEGSGSGEAVVEEIFLLFREWDETHREVTGAYRCFSELQNHTKDFSNLVQEVFLRELQQT